MQPEPFKDVGKKSLATSMVAMVLEQGMIITPFVRPWLTTTKIEFLPRTSGRSVTRSTEICLKGSDEDKGIGVNGGQVGWVFTLFC